MLRSVWWYIGGLLCVLTAVPVVLTFPGQTLILSALGFFLLFLAKQGVWRGMVAVSIAVSALRSSEFSETLPETAWYAAQFGTILLAALSTLRLPTRRATRAEHAAVLFLFGYVLVAAVSGLSSPAPAETYAQVALFGCVAIFLALTFLRRWATGETIRGDLAAVFWTITGVQGIGLFGALTSSWGFDPDYGRYVGLFSNANYAGVMSAMSIAIGVFLIAAAKPRWPYVGAIAVLAIGMVMSGSRGAILALTAGVIVLALSRGSRRMVFTITAGLGLALAGVVSFRPDLLAEAQSFFARDAAADFTSGRVLIYGDLIQQFSTSPVIGTGYRTSELTSGVAGHNVYLSVLAETGMIGAMIFAALMLAVIVASRAGRAHRPLVGAVVTVAVMELTESSIFGFGGPTALTAWLVVFAFAAWGATMRSAPIERSPSSIARVPSLAPTR